MKSKYITIILSIILIGSIGINIYQYVTTSNLKSSLSTLTNTKNELTAEIDNKTAELNNITSEIEEANNTISDLTAKKDNLATENKDMQSKIDTLQAEITDESDTVDFNIDELTEEDEAIVDQILKELEAEHPEWFTDTFGNTSEGNYEHVGTPDNGELPTYTIGESGNVASPAGTIY